MYKINCDACGTDQEWLHKPGLREVMPIPVGWTVVYLRTIDNSDKPVIEMHICPKCIPQLGEDALNRRMREAIDLRPQLAQEEKVSKSHVRDLLEMLGGHIDIPERRCTCHISPPCSDCQNNSGAREALESLKSMGLMS